MRRSFPLVVCLLAAAVLANAVSEEQAAQHSWHQQYIGNVKQLQFAFKGRDRCFVATEANAIASLDLLDGKIVWRQTLLEDDAINGIVLVPRPAAVVTVSQYGQTLRAWHAGDGSLLWESFLGNSLHCGDSNPHIRVLPDVTGDGSSDIAVLSNRTLLVVSGSSGKPVWTYKLPDNWVYGQLTVTEHESELLLAATGVSASSKSVVATLLVSAKVGEFLGKHEHHLAHSVEEPMAVKADNIFAVAQGGKLFCMLSLHGIWHIGKGDSQCKPLEGAPSSQLQLLDIDSAKIVALRTEKGVAVLAAGSEGIKSVIHVPGASVVSNALSVEKTEGVVLAGASEDGSTWARLAWLGEWTTVDLELDQQPSGEAGHIVSAALGAKDLSSKEAAQDSIRLVTVGEDESVVLRGKGSVRWVREEALGSVTGSLFLDLPAPSPELAAKWRAAAPTLSERIQAEFFSIKAQLGAATPQEKAALAGLKARMSSNLLPFRDPNGFRKLLVLLSKSGKVFGVHSGDGHVLWSRTLGSGRRPTHLALWRTSHDAAAAPEVLLLGNVPSTGAAFFATLNAHTGAETSSGHLPFEVAQVLELGERVHDGKSEQSVYALVSADAQPQVHLLPDSALTRPLLETPSKPLHFWRADASTGVIEGFAVGGRGAASLLWSVVFPPSTDAILATATPGLHDPVYSYAKVLGNRSLKLKYLNPNTLFVATGTQPGQANGAERHITAHIFDTVTGQLLFSQTHEGANGPVHAVLAENWVVYTYWSAASHRFQASVLELYDDSPRSLGPVELVFGANNATLSSYQPPAQLQVLAQSYFVPFGVKALAATTTSKGITSKIILMGTFTDQVYMMDKRFFDPRRPLGAPTAEDKAEMLIPYAAELPLAPQLFATHDRLVANLQGIDSSPANLESTCFALARGLDLYLTWVQPSKTFDLLPEDFPFALLVSVTLTMIGASIALKYMSERASLKLKWT